MTDPRIIHIITEAVLFVALIVWLLTRFRHITFHFKHLHQKLDVHEERILELEKKLVALTAPSLPEDVIEEVEPPALSELATLVDILSELPPPPSGGFNLSPILEEEEHCPTLEEEEEEIEQHYPTLEDEEQKDDGELNYGSD